MAIQAIQEKMETLFLPPDPYAAPLRQALAKSYGVGEDCIVVGNGSTEIMNALVISELNERGGDVLVSSPTFSLYSLLAEIHGFGLKTVPLNNYVHNVESLKKAAVSSTVRIIFVDSPHYITGTTIATSALIDLAVSVPETVIVLDNIYGEYQTNEISEFVRQVALDSPSNILICRSFSKAHALLGLRVGYGIGHPDLIKKIRNKIMPYSINAIAQVAAVASLQDIKNVQRNLELNERAKRMSYQLLDELSIAYVPTESNVLLIKFGKSEAKRIAKFCDQQGIKYRGEEKCGIPNHIQVHLIDPETVSPFLNLLRKYFRKVDNSVC